MKITTRAKVKHLLTRGYKTRRFDRGKYKWTGTLLDYVNLEVPDLDGVVAVFAVQRRDQYGDYVALMAVHK